MNTNYKQLFACEVRHEHYPTPAYDTNFGLTEDFVLKPTARTRQLMKDFRLLFRPDSAGFQVLFQEQLTSLGAASYLINPSTDIPTGTRFDFEMHLKNPYFNNFTDLFHYLPSSTPPVTGGTPLPRFDNKATTTLGNLNYTVDYLRPSIFRYRPNISPDSPASLSLQASDPDGNVLVSGETVTPDALTGEYEYPVNFKGEPTGQYTFVSTYSGGTLSPFTEYLYLDDTLFHQRPFGLISIYMNADFDFSMGLGSYEGKLFTASFQVPEKLIRYILVSNDDTMPTLSMTDGTTAVGDLPPSRWENQAINFGFTAAAVVTDPEYLGLGKYVQEILTTQKYPVYQEAKQDLTISRNSGTMSINVPSPSIQSAKREVIIYL